MIEMFCNISCTAPPTVITDCFIYFIFQDTNAKKAWSIHSVLCLLNTNQRTNKQTNRRGKPTLRYRFSGFDCLFENMCKLFSNFFKDSRAWSGKVFFRLKTFDLHLKILVGCMIRKTYKVFGIIPLEAEWKNEEGEKSCLFSS